jgi:hypothetical protein
MLDSVQIVLYNDAIGRPENTRTWAWRHVAGKGFSTRQENGRRSSLGSFQSGQMELTVNQLAQPSGVRIPHCPPDICPCGAAVAHSLGKTGVMGSIPITGSCFSLSKGWLRPGPVERNNCNRLLLPVLLPRQQAAGLHKAGAGHTTATRHHLLTQAFPSCTASQLSCAQEQMGTDPVGDGRCMFISFSWQDAAILPCRSTLDKGEPLRIWQRRNLSEPSHM